MDHADAVPIAELLDERRYLLDVADWMVGSRGEAESVVDETYRRWFGLSEAARRRIAAPRSWLAKTAGAICLSRLALQDRADDIAREVGVAEGPRAGARPTAMLEAEDEVSRVQLNVLDSLSPAERVRFLLKDVFGMTPGTVTDILGRTEPERAELADRALRFLQLQRSNPTTPQQHDTVARAVRQACLTEDAGLLASLLRPDATAFFDGGAKVRALARPVHGRRQVARSLLTLLARHPRTTLTARSVNGRTGLVTCYDRQVVAVISLDIADHHVAQAWVVLNPDKLRSWNQPRLRHGGSLGVSAYT